MIVRASLFATLLALTLTNVAHAEFTWNGASATDDISGIGFRSSTQILFDNTDAMTGIQMREKADDPVYIQIFGRRLCPKNSTSCSLGRSARSWFLKPGVNGNAHSSKDVFVNDWQYVTGLSVCMNRNNTKIKGVRLKRGEIDDNGVVTRINGSVRFRRTNCHDWPHQVDCPTGQVVVGLRVRYNGTSDGASGLQPICASIVAPTVAPADGRTGIGIQSN